jgi:hypothetical protein
MMTVYLVPVGHGRFELYSEPPDPDRAGDPGGWLRRRMHTWRERWHETVAAARVDDPRGRFARWRGTVICRLAETIGEQRTLWSLRDQHEVTLVYPADLDEASARALLRAELGRARGHHRNWLALDTGAFIASGLLMLVPGPNLIAYYFAFRLIGHYLSWRGAVRGQNGLMWIAAPDERLVELRALADLPRPARAPRVEAIAASLNLEQLAAFFDRAAAPAR